MAGQHKNRPASEHGPAGNTAAPAGKETQPDNSKCQGTAGNTAGFGGIEEGSSRQVGYEGS
jgi:hypothetical protein